MYMQITKMLRLQQVLLCVWTYVYTTEENTPGKYGADIRTACTCKFIWITVKYQAVLHHLRLDGTTYTHLGRNAGNKWSQVSNIITGRKNVDVFFLWGNSGVGVEKLRLALHFIDSLYLFWNLNMHNILIVYSVFIHIQSYTVIYMGSSHQQRWITPDFWRFGNIHDLWPLRLQPAVAEYVQVRSVFLERWWVTRERVNTNVERGWKRPI